MQQRIVDREVADLHIPVIGRGRCGPVTAAVALPRIAGHRPGAVLGPHAEFDPDIVERKHDAAIFGPIALVTSGGLLVGGFWMRQRNKEAVSYEDRALDEAWGDETFTDYNPQDYR